MSDIHDKHPSEDALQAFLDGGVRSRERRRIEAHLASCTRCAEELASWRVLFEDLDALGSLRPSVDFQERVMAGVRVPAELHWAARARTRLAALATGGRPDHLEAGLLQDLADGTLPRRLAARAHKHLEGCAVCAGELRSWSGVLARLSELDRFAPSEGFAEGVMAAFEPAEQRAVAPAAAGRWALSRALATVKRFVPRTRRAWAAISGAAVTPAVTFGLLLYTVFSHPTLTPQALASFVFWQLTDLIVAGWGTLVSGSLSAARVAGLDGLVQLLVDAPFLAAGGLALYAIALVAALRILYKNLFASRTPRPVYASASVS